MFNNGYDDAVFRSSKKYWMHFRKKQAIAKSFIIAISNGQSQTLNGVKELRFGLRMHTVVESNNNIMVFVKVQLTVKGF